MFLHVNELTPSESRCLQLLRDLLVYCYRTAAGIEQPFLLNPQTKEFVPSSETNTFNQENLKASSSKEVGTTSVTIKESG